ncbi:7095_t:CDS:2 [Cetraspora pellucida]|uniref:7095_t:CDS:1 n=1 Tax=Cetraspora pellucida TaxID=1433469 RepID=A0A9N9NSA1_9GLOM|nr:7095_t:CDS:2 [Cetraspora pellucida]
MANELPTSNLENQRLNIIEPAMPPTPVLTDPQYKIGVDTKTPNNIDESSNIYKSNELQSDVSRQDHIRIFDPLNLPNEMDINAKDHSNKDTASNENIGVAAKSEASVEKKTRGRKKVNIVDKNVVVGTNIETNSEEKGGNKSQELIVSNDDAEAATLEKSQQGYEGTERPDNDKDVKLPEKRARGRPKKEVSNGTTEESSKVRGRPKNDKIVTATVSNDTNSSEKRRGRPKREGINVTSNNVTNSIVKRGRGRPKQSESSSVANVLQKRTRGRPKKESGGSISIEKRRPGRPKATNKDVFDGPTRTDDDDKATTSGLSEKRGRGRPRKNPLLSQIGKSKKRSMPDKSSNGTPKPRGRPRKITTKKEDVDVSNSGSETKIPNIDTAVPAEVSTAKGDQTENLAQSTDSNKDPYATQVDPFESLNAVTLNEQEPIPTGTAKTSNGESVKKRGRPKRDDQTEQELTKKVKA